jgi:citrate lyase beta subunit
MAPVVLAFVKDDSEASARLAERIDRLVQEHKDQGLRGFVVFIAGPEKKARLEQIAAEHKTSIPLVVLPKGTEDPALQRYKIDMNAANTVIVYKKKKAVYTAMNVTLDAFNPVVEAAKSIVKTE